FLDIITHDSDYFCTELRRLTPELRFALIKELNSPRRRVGETIDIDGETIKSLIHAFEDITDSLLDTENSFNHNPSTDVLANPQYGWQINHHEDNVPLTSRLHGLIGMATDLSHQKLEVEILTLLSIIDGEKYLFDPLDIESKKYNSLDVPKVPPKRPPAAVIRESANQISEKLAFETELLDERDEKDGELDDRDLSEIYYLWAAGISLCMKVGGALSLDNFSDFSIKYPHFPIVQLDKNSRPRLAFNAQTSLTTAKERWEGLGFDRLQDHLVKNILNTTYQTTSAVGQPKFMNNSLVRFWKKPSTD
ncbi:uncharacterized protein METZ01_LOCUS368014, partial [marine metagenome]